MSAGTLQDPESATGEHSDDDTFSVSVHSFNGSDDECSDDFEAWFNEVHRDRSDEQKTFVKLQDSVEQRLLNFEYCEFLSDLGLSEPFLVDGDALIVHALETPFLDWRYGGQFLHLVYIFEQTLVNLWKRGARFEVFFMIENRSVFESRGSSYLLIRTVIIHHLRSQQTSRLFQLRIHLIPCAWHTANVMGPTSQPWTDFVRSFRPSFILTMSECKQHLLTSVAIRHFGHLQLVAGHFVVSLESITLEGSRVKGFLFRSPDPLTTKVIHKAYTKVTEYLGAVFYDSSVRTGFEPSSESQTFSPTIQHVTGGVSELYLRALCSLLTESSTDVQRFLAFVSCVSVELMRQLPIAKRALFLPGESEGKDVWSACGISEATKNMIKDFVNTLHVYLERSLHLQDFVSDTVVDCFDGRLFMLTLIHMIGGATVNECFFGLSDALIAQLELQIDVQNVVGYLGISHIEIESVKASLSSFSEPSSKNHLSLSCLYPVGECDTLLSGVLCRVQSKMQKFEAAEVPSESFLGLFSAHHFHSVRPLSDEPDSFTYDLSIHRMSVVHKGRNWAWKQQQRKLFQLQRAARANLHYQECLLVGTPVKKKIIAEKLSPGELRDLMTKAIANLSSSTERAQRGREKQRALSKKEKIILENEKRMQAEALEKDMIKLENFKEQRKKDDVHSLVPCLQLFADQLVDEVCLKANIYCLQRICKHFQKERKRKATFLSAQAILRRFKGVLGIEDKDLIGKILEKQGFEDLSMTVVGTSARSSRGASGQSSVQFQLEEVPEHLARPKGVESDPRVGFSPDNWQKTLLDVVDSGNSALVVAPTASGKTFISYYVMEQCLRADDDGVVVYVAPTKALVNQVRAEIDARFSKAYQGAKKVASVFTRDFREDNMLNAQILVTVPACLGILMLTGSNTDWASRIRHVIFDEIHCLGQTGGQVWEQLLLIIDCPFLALSATLGNVEMFHTWLSKIEESRNRKVYLVQHRERFNDLKHWLFGHDESNLGVLMPLSPFWTIKRARQERSLSLDMFPTDLKLLPEDCMDLFKIMSKIVDQETLAKIHPDRFFAELGSDYLWNASMEHASKWSELLKAELCKQPQEYQNGILMELAKRSEEGFQGSDTSLGSLGEYTFIRKYFSQMIEDLRKNEMLPCICFSMNRERCERLAVVIFEHFRHREQLLREEEGWQAKLDKLMKERDISITRLEKCKGAVTLSDGETVDDSAEYLEYIKSLERKIAELKRPHPDFVVAQITVQDIEDMFGSLPFQKHWTDFTKPHLIAPLLRGVGVHHSGLSKYYRQAVEKLFRSKRLGIVIATSTLAMGINMPSKTSVFVGDAVYLNAMNFRQMAGRAGRRGFDLRGHVVFFGISSPKVFRLQRSDLPRLVGNLVQDNSMALRLVMHQYALRSSKKASAQDRMNGILSCARLIQLPLFNPLQADFGEDFMGDQMAHCFRFSIEYLCRNRLLHIGEDGELEPSDLGAFAAHLYFMEPSNFAFLALLTAHGGAVLSGLCRPGPQREEKVMTVLCHIFCRFRVPRSAARFAREFPAATGPSKVVLEALETLGDLVRNSAGQQVRQGQLVKEVLQKHNEDSVRLLVNYWSCFVESFSVNLGIDNILPFSRCSFAGNLQPSRSDIDGGSSTTLLESLDRHVVNVRVRSAFVALSGHGDDYDSVEELCNTARSGIYLDPKMVPIFSLNDSHEEPVNSFLLDFFKHGQIEALTRYNHIDENDRWDALKNFALVLKALWAAMERRVQAAAHHRQKTLFDDPNVVETFRVISERFNEALRVVAA